MAGKDSSTEEMILNAAKEVFIRKGKAGARMQEIANEAKINKALLHYYYRSKDKLFEAVFKLAFKMLFPRIKKAVTEEQNVFLRIERFVDVYISAIQKNPFLPNFVLSELNSNPGGLVDVFNSADIPINGLLDGMKQAMAEGYIREMDPKHLAVNVVSLCVFPFIAKPMVSALFFDGNKKAYNEFIEERKTEVSNFIVNSIKLKDYPV